MDVSEWTIDQRMRLPDWCFGNRTLIGCQVIIAGAITNFWGISEIALPDPCCIWQLVYFFRPSEFTRLNLRIGLAATVPTSEAEMDAAKEIFPYFGSPATGPNILRIGILYSTPMSIMMRKGMATDGLKLVCQGYFSDGTGYCNVGLLCSGLPTSMAGWMAHNRV